MSYLKTCEFSCFIFLTFFFNLLKVVKSNPTRFILVTWCLNLFDSTVCSLSSLNRQSSLVFPIFAQTGKSKMTKLTTSSCLHAQFVT